MNLASAQTEVIVNGDFASGPSSWILSGRFQADSRFATCRSCPGYAYLANLDGTAGNNLVGNMYQTITIPSGATSVTLSFWYHITTAQTGGIGSDELNVTIETANGSFLDGVAFLSNTDTNSAYQQRTFNLTARRGQTVRVNFMGTTDGSGATAFRVDDVSVLATVPPPTATIADAWWSNQVDIDEDGYKSAFRLNWNPNVVNSSGSLSVYEKIYYKNSSASTWNLFSTTSPHNITGTSTGDQQFLDILGASHALWDWRIDVYRDGITLTDYTRDPSNDSDLNDYPLELATEDNTVSAIIADAWWSNLVDNDADGYKSAFRLNWNPNVRGSNGTLIVYEKIYYKVSSDNTWSLFLTTPTHAIAGTETNDQQVTDIIGGGHGLWDWRIEVYHDGAGSADYTRDPLNDADLNDYQAELPGEDTPPSVPTVQTLAASAVGTTTAMLNGQIVNGGGSTIVERRFEWAKSTGNWGAGVQGVDYGVIFNASISPSGSTFSAPLAGVTPSTAYKYRASARNSTGWSDTTSVNVVTFTTHSGPTPDIRIEPLSFNIACSSGFAPAGAVAPLPVSEDGQLAGAGADINPAKSEALPERPLTPRRAILKPRKSVVGKGAYPGVIAVRFQDGLRIRARNGSLTDFGTRALDGARDAMAALAGGRWERVDVLAEEKVDELRTKAERSLGKRVADLNLQFRFYLPAGMEPERAIDTLNALDVVEIAEPIVRPAVPPLPPDYQANQGYLLSAPAGINALGAGTRGAGIKVVDIEYSFNARHLDLPPVINLDSAAIDPGGEDFGPNHGTAVLGELGARANGFGTTGIAPDATYYFSGAYFPPPVEYNLPRAITTALTALRPGDVLLIEQQIARSDADPTTYAPVEWDRMIYDRIQTAVGLGVVVVEAAGNGNQNLDDPFYTTANGGHWPFIPENDSGAILVGAGAAPASFGGSTTARSRLWFSNYGSTVDLQGWGEKVWTTGCFLKDTFGDCQDAYSVEGENLYFTSAFSGTSSASPIVAGACVLLQAAYKARTGELLSSEDLKAILRSTGSPQQTGVNPVTQNIGPMPNVTSAITRIVPPTSGGSFRIHNDGAITLNVTSIATDQAAPWISWQPAAPFVVLPGSYRTVSISMDCSRAPCGSNTTRLLVNSNDGDESPYPVGVTIQINKPDATKPTITACGTNRSAILNDQCQASVPDFTAAVTATDNCTSGGSLSKSQAPLVGTLVGPGTHPITITVQDLAGNSAMCTRSFTVADTLPPAITCPARLSVNTEPGLCHATNVNLGSPTISDNCTVSGITNDAPSQYPVGSTIVTWTVTDTAGLTATCQQTVTVVEPSPPSLTVEQQGQFVLICWPQTCALYSLKQTTSLTPPITWSRADATVVVEDGKNCSILPMGSGSLFLRLESE